MTAATWQLQALGVMLLHCDQTVKDTENDWGKSWGGVMKAALSFPALKQREQARLIEMCFKFH